MTGPIETVSGRGLSLPDDNIDTDQIIESRHLKMTTFHGMEAHVFESSRRIARETRAVPIEQRRRHLGITDDFMMP
ncbi:hypothetical protein, partial [Allomesorhizobium camelthorni]